MDAVLGAGHTDARSADVFEADVEHQIVVLALDDLAGGDPVLFPLHILVGNHHGIALVLFPVNAVFARGIADGIGLTDFTGRIPHFENLLVIIPDHMRIGNAPSFP